MEMEREREGGEIFLFPIFNVDFGSWVGFFFFFSNLVLDICA